MPSFPPALNQTMDALPHAERHLHRSLNMILLWQRIVEQYQYAVSDKALQGSFELQHELSDRIVVLPENGDHFLRLCRLGKTRKAAQIPEHDRDVAPVALQGIRSTPPCDHKIRHLGRQEPAQALHSPDLLNLLSDAPL
jgi:hypothetical protein